MLKLFSVYLGGRAERCNIELHDVVFVVSESIEQAYPALVNKWFGIKKRLHIDSYITLDYADGYKISISKHKPEDAKRLFFVNFGAYKENYFGEVHEANFYVGKTKNEVLMRAKDELCLNGIDPHCDDNVAIDDIIEINKIDNYYLHFIPTNKQKIDIVSDYCCLDLPDSLYEVPNQIK